MNVLVNLFIITGMIFTLTGCTPTANPAINQSVPYGDLATGNPAGFYDGIWHGFIIPFSLAASLTSPEINIYETHNDGKKYNFGFFLGLGIFIWAFSKKT